jgi:cell division protein FtsW (lipid II flippase)
MKRAARQAATWAAIVVGGALAAAYTEIKHPSTPLRIVALACALLLLVRLLAFGVDAAKVVRDWLWLRREDWRDWRRRQTRA